MERNGPLRFERGLLSKGVEEVSNGPNFLGLIRLTLLKPEDAPATGSLLPSSIAGSNSMKMEDLLVECPKGAAPASDGRWCSPLEVLLTLLLFDLLLSFLLFLSLEGDLSILLSRPVSLSLATLMEE